MLSFPLPKVMGCNLVGKEKDNESSKKIKEPVVKFNKLRLYPQ